MSSLPRFTNLKISLTELPTSCISSPDIMVSGNDEMYSSIFTNQLVCSEIYSLMLSSVDTACQSVTLTYDGMFGSCDTSSSLLIAFAARTAIGS